MLAALSTGDPKAAWTALGFGDPVRVGPLEVVCDGGHGWTLVGDGPEDVDGIPTRWVAEGGADLGDLDHVVVVTGSLDRTVAALVAVGGDERRRLDVGRGRMAFVRMGRVIVEVVERDGVGEGASLWGLVAVRDDLAALPAALVGEVRDAVQPGRRIVTAQPVDGLRTAVAFMTPRVRTR